MEISTEALNSVTVSTWSYLKNESRNITCVSRQTPTFLIFCLFPTMAVFINLVILAAVLRKARKLMRQSHVYLHVSSTLIGNVLFSILALIQLLSLYFHIGGDPDHPDPAYRSVVRQTSSQWWTFHKSFLCGMFVIMCGNIGLLIDCIRHNTCSALRTAAGHRSYQNDSGSRWKKRILTRRQRAYLLISLLWIIPFIYVVVPVGGWNCSQVCHCLSQCFSPNHRFKPSDYACSRAFPPMANSWLAVVVGGWLFCLLATIYLLKRSVQKVTKMWAQCSIKRDSYQNEELVQPNGRKATMASIQEISRNDSDVKTPEKNIIDSTASFDTNDNCNSLHGLVTKTVVGDPKDDVFVDDSVADENSSGKKWESQVIPERKYFSVGRDRKCPRVSRTSDTSTSTVCKAKGYGTHRRMLEHLRNTRATTFSLRFVIWLTVSFVLCTAPSMAILTVDMLTPSLKLDMVVLNTCLLCPFVYCYICPFILVKCLPGVKTSLSALILSVYSTTD
ncbi:uncharacterized protein LOC143458987 [Clavelina lepadiformis]|uniref:G-protein coupled receptors family 1 profile domain-containing protein n=1 Tax=Clavelina lepadiformis TaxID=159417 RepID=A0ABP0F8P1_CLALP